MLYSTKPKISRTRSFLLSTFHGHLNWPCICIGTTKKITTRCLTSPPSSCPHRSIVARCLHMNRTPRTTVLVMAASWHQRRLTFLTFDNSCRGVDTMYRSSDSQDMIWVMKKETERGRHVSARNAAETSCAQGSEADIAGATEII